MIKLYDNDAYAREFDAVVTAVEPLPDGASAWVTLDRTLFFPEEGGQSPDRGELNGCAVTDVQIKGDTIRHLVALGETAEGGNAGKPGESTEGGSVGAFAEGSTVHGRIDWEYRYRNMQMHTGEHIFSGLVHGTYGYDNVGFHLSDRTATMDYNGKLTEQQLLALETEANRIITENRIVRAWYPEKEELAELAYRSKKEIDGAVRLVEVAGVDLCACCAPHVKLTGEVGCFKLIGWENYKGGVRVSYRCGFRAMEDYGERMELLTKLSRLLSVKTEDLADAVERLSEEKRKLAYDLVAKDRAITLSRIEAMAAADREKAGMQTGGAATEDDRIGRSILLLLEAGDASLLRYAVDELKKRYTGVVCAMLSTGKTEGDGNGEEQLSWRYLMEQDGGDVSGRQQLLKERFGAKGGGPKNSVQGSVTATAGALRQWFDECGE